MVHRDLWLKASRGGVVKLSPRGVASPPGAVSQLTPVVVVELYTPAWEHNCLKQNKVLKSISLRLLMSFQGKGRALGGESTEVGSTGQGWVVSACFIFVLPSFASQDTRFWFLPLRLDSMSVL